MTIIYNKTTGEVFGRYLRTEWIPEESVIHGIKNMDGSLWDGFHISCNPETYELTPSQEAAWDDTKLYSFDPNTKTLTERERPKTPEEIQAEQLERIEAQSTYTAMMTDTLI